MATRFQEQDPAQVELYALSTCNHCKAVSKLLGQLDIPYDEIEVDLLDDRAREQALAKMRRHNPRVTFPTTVIGGEAVVGNKPQIIQAKLSQTQKGG
jgi:glutaredoxin